MALVDLILDRASARKRRERFFPEIGATIYVSPWTCAERAQAIRSAQQHKFASEYEIDVLLLKAETEEGGKAFSPHDRIRLLHKGDPDVIGRIAEFLVGPEVFVNEREEVEALGEPSAPIAAPTSLTTSSSPTS